MRLQQCLKVRLLSLIKTEVRLKNYDPEVEKLIDIGFPKLHVSRSVEQKKQSAHLKELRQDPELERRARNHQCKLDRIAKGNRFR